MASEQTRPHEVRVKRYAVFEWCWHKDREGTPLGDGTISLQPGQDESQVRDQLLPKMPGSCPDCSKVIQSVVRGFIQMRIACLDAFNGLGRSNEIESLLRAHDEGLEELKRQWTKECESAATGHSNDEHVDPLKNYQARVERLTEVGNIIADKAIDLEIPTSMWAHSIARLVEYIMTRPRRPHSESKVLDHIRKVVPKLLDLNHSNRKEKDWEPYFDEMVEMWLVQGSDAL
ncbi:hypothetical protein JX265_010045 [Neoarthrinium moseri]|uniref:Uncharacterized protein n=1 Tax=Neoarthrinium moseri TaxID=1658444 RepID=A0A9P9WF43_9PEZI|nr:hypothetical protein JX265_010045 [Neoarthrinium moseri]